MGPHCFPVCKNRFEKFARIFSRRHKQTAFSDAGFLGALRVNIERKGSLNVKPYYCMNRIAGVGVGCGGGCGGSGFLRFQVCSNRILLLGCIS